MLRNPWPDGAVRGPKFHETRPPAPRNPSPPENPRRSFTLQLELQVRREEALLVPTNARVLLDLAALLCRLGTPEELVEDIQVYTGALLQVRSTSQPITPHAHVAPPYRRPNACSCPPFQKESGFVRITTPKTRFCLVMQPAP
jgi:hypothetical protein